jgi:hypothetical protein
MPILSAIALGAFQTHDKMLHSDRLPVSSFITLQAFTASKDTASNQQEMESKIHLYYIFYFLSR